MRVENMDVVERLLASPEPSLRYKISRGVLGKAVSSPEMLDLQEQIRRSPRVAKLLSERDEFGRIPHHPYAKWDGAHWVLAVLADMHYPSGDQTLIPLREQALKWLLSPGRSRSLTRIEGRVRRCASQEANAVYYLLSLGLADERVDLLVQNLLAWQWPDGGWNCDKNPGAINSSFMESLIPLRALALHARLTGSEASLEGAGQTAEIFLKRRLHRRVSDKGIMAQDFMRLHYPCYWHYDVLFGLKVMEEAGYLGDPRCRDALNWLESRRLEEGGFPADGKYYRMSEKRTSNRSLVDWGASGRSMMNEYVTAEALSVLQAAGRLG